jgi:hypothetical protein
MAEPAKKKKAGIWRYLREAFTFRWNLLFFGGALAAAVLSPSPDVFVPLVAAAEVAYLGGLATLPRFQGAIDAKQHKEDRAAGGGTTNEDKRDAKQRLLDVLGGLEAERRNRFLRLRARCVEMQRIATTVRGDTRDASGAAHEFRTPALDRLLWVFLRLLLAQQAVDKFLRATDEEALKKNLENLQKRQRDAEAKKDERILRSVTDAMATAELRMSNVEKAKGNFEFITLELDRIEQKIHALMEMAISHTDPDELSVQVDAVAEGMQQTEQTIRELQAITGLGSDADATPEILGGDLTEAVKQ